MGLMICDFKLEINWVEKCLEIPINHIPTKSKAERV